MAFDRVRNVTVLHGGYSGGGVYSDETWEWNGVAWSLRNIPGPGARSAAGMSYDSTRHAFLLFGGINANLPAAYLGDTWEYDGTAWFLRQAANTGGPPGRGCHAQAYDATRNLTTIFAGYNNAASYLGDTWVWNGASWTQRPPSPPAPNPRYYAPMTADPHRAFDILFGGLAQGGPAYNAQTWQFDGTNWTNLPISGPAARYATALAYDTRRHAAILFGGYNGQYLADTWQLITNCPADFNAVDGVTVQDLFDYLAAWFTTSPRADFNGQGGVTLQDLFDYLAAWFAAC